MAKVPDLKRITVEDFPSDQQALVSKLAFIINSFHESVRSALNGNLDFTNIAQEIKTLEFTTGDNGQPLAAISFKSGLNNRVQGIMPVRVIITSNNLQYATQLPVFSWSQDGQIIRITNVGGLEPNKGYSITVLTI